MIVPTICCLRSALSAGFLIKLHKTQKNQLATEKC